MCDSKELDRYFECAKQLMIEAGKLIIEGINIDKHVEFKSDVWDLVTKYDSEVEQILMNGLKKAFPSHKFIAEETSALTKSIPELSNDPTWIIDPIDGTTNFVHGYPQTCISVALAIDKRLQIGIIYNPSYDELYTAKSGQGAYFNGKLMKTSNITDIGKAVLSADPSILYQSPSQRLISLRRAEAFALQAQGVRNCGSSALTLAYVARGILDVFQCVGLKPWDVAAGIILVEEAGGYICNSKGGPYNLKEIDLIAASNKQLATQIIQLMIKTDLKTQRDKQS